MQKLFVEKIQISKKNLKLNEDIISEQRIRNSDGLLGVRDKNKKIAQKSYDKCVLNDFAQDRNSLSQVDIISSVPE